MNVKECPKRKGILAGDESIDICEDTEHECTVTFGDGYCEYLEKLRLEEEAAQAEKA